MVELFLDLNHKNMSSNIEKMPEASQNEFSKERLIVPGSVMALAGVMVVLSKKMDEEGHAIQAERAAAHEKEIDEHADKIASQIQTALQINLNGPFRPVPYSDYEYKIERAAGLDSRNITFKVPEHLDYHDSEIIDGIVNSRVNDLNYAVFLGVSTCLAYAHAVSPEKLEVEMWCLPSSDEKTNALDDGPFPGNYQ